MGQTLQPAAWMESGAAIKRTSPKLDAQKKPNAKDNWPETGSNPDLACQSLTPNQLRQLGEKLLYVDYTTLRVTQSSERILKCLFLATSGAI